MARLEMEGNQINLDNLEKGIDNSAFSSLGEEELCEERDGPHGGNERKRGEGNGRVASYCRKALQPASKAKRFCKAHTKALRRVCWGILGAAYLCYFIAACWLNFQRALALVVITVVVIFFMCWSLFKKYCGAKVLTLLSPLWKCLQKSWPWLKWLLYVLLLGGLVTWLALDTAKKPEQLISLAGFCVLVLFLFAFSKHHSAVSWRAVFWGLGLEFLIGLFILRTTPGIQAFQWLGDQIQVFLGYTKAGSSFVFGNTLIEDVFAFQSLPIIIFFSCVMSILYYLGVMQWLILKISWLLQISLGTTPTETLSVAGNIFVGQTEAPLLIRPYLADMTHSEIHAVMAGGFSTIAGSVMGAYISFGIDAALLIAASVMAAPCALAMSKLVYPEVEESKFKGKESVRISSGEERNILEAASNGAAASIGLVANIAANLIAFLAVLEFINAALRWFGEMVEIKDLSFQMICSYVLMPVAFLMGADWADSPLVAELLGIKIFLNEFVAYQQLATYKRNRLSGLEEWSGSRKQWISERAESITTFALCGFANLSSIGIMLGGLTSMVPHRKSELASIVLRALLTGICVSMLNSCLAGLLYVPTEVGNCVTILINANFTSTNYTIYTCCKQLFASTVLENGTLSFTGAWDSVADSLPCLTGCCRHYNHTHCTA
ncbi:sodium/nucleoside cotransporter 1-like isoform X2 [Lagopus muta]|nr:sodium/nucleoside cotransporter 1-like isoform X2 [Lagopus muta]XP_048812067.1 sodium/nucleoside cotransporter 1-like isoform X2 [Lagopus muta]XP_048812068.1 sodium/nucleoside cotransporter 1-like isoform X2 [Lagopus muta]XP_048812069.1 sodium/nucleoside cotransporter 1-like isoform X2 [Lagopus muta]